MEKVQISPRQLTFLIITLIISTADVFLPAFVAQEAKQDSWLSVVFSIIFIFPVVWLILKLYWCHEGKTLIQICSAVTGKVIGKAIGLLYVFYFLFLSWNIAITMSIVLNTAFYPLTPSWVIIVITILVTAYAVDRDIEVIARVNEILMPMGLGIFGFLMLVNIGEMNLDFFRPVLNNGIVPPILGGIVILGWLSEIIVILQMAHFINKPKQLNKSAFIGIIVTGAGILIGTLVYALFGPLTEVFLMPALEFARFASIGKYIRNFDLLVMAIWITGIYVKIMLCYYSGTYALAQVFQVKNYKTLVLPVGLLLISMALVSSKRSVETLNFLHYIFPAYSLVMALIIPGLLFLLSHLKKNKGRE